MSDLDREFAAFERLKPEIVREHGSVWALVAHEALVETFSEFSSAAKYAVEHFPGREVLIKHTSERIETAPFVGING